VRGSPLKSYKRTFTFYSSSSSRTKKTKSFQFLQQSCWKLTSMILRNIQGGPKTGPVWVLITQRWLPVKRRVICQNFYNVVDQKGRQWRHFIKSSGGSTLSPFLFPPFLLLPFFLPFSPPFLSSFMPSPPLRSRPPLNPARGLGEHCKLPSGVWGGAPAEIEFGAFSALNVTSRGNNLNDFPKNQLTKFCAVYTVNVYNSH